MNSAFKRFSDCLAMIFPAYAYYNRGKAEEPIFIIGCGRSGNTLLRSMLMAGGELTIPPESYVLSSISRRYALWRFRGWACICEQVCTKLSSHPEFDAWQIDIDLVLEKAKHLPKDERNLQALIKLIYMAYGQIHGFGTTRWGDKTPLNTLYLNDIVRVFPKAKFIHIVRDPRAVASSYVRAAANNPHIAEKTFALAAARWRESVQAVNYLKRSTHGEQVIEVRYEDLVTAPEEQLRKICMFTGLSFADSMLNHAEQNVSLGDVERHGHHKDVQSAIDPSKVFAWQDRVSSEDSQLVMSITGTEAKAMGYL